MTFIVPDELLLQMKTDGIDFIHVRDFVSVDIEKDGSYTTDWDAFDKKIELRDGYINKISQGLDAWFNSITSDGGFYKYVEENCINVHAEDLEALL